MGLAIGQDSVAVATCQYLHGLDAALALCGNHDGTIALGQHTNCAVLRLALGVNHCTFAELNTLTHNNLSRNLCGTIDAYVVDDGSFLQSLGVELALGGEVPNIGLGHESELGSTNNHGLLCIPPTGVTNFLGSDIAGGIEIQFGTSRVHAGVFGKTLTTISQCISLAKSSLSTPSGVLRAIKIGACNIEEIAVLEFWSETATTILTKTNLGYYGLDIAVHVQEHVLRTCECLGSHFGNIEDTVGVGSDTNCIEGVVGNNDTLGCDVNTQERTTAIAPSVIYDVEVFVFTITEVQQVTTADCVTVGSEFIVEVVNIATLNTDVVATATCTAATIEYAFGVACDFAIYDCQFGYFCTLVINYKTCCVDTIEC